MKFLSSRSKREAIAYVGTAAASAAAFLVIVGSPAGPATASPPIGFPLPADAALAGSFKALRGTPPVSDAPGQTRLAELYGKANGDLRVSRTDFGQARSVPVNGVKARAWVAPAGDEICAFTPDPTDGYTGASCYDAEAVKAGTAISFVRPNTPNTPIVVSVLVADGGEAPVLKHSDGTKRTLTVVNNLAVSTAAPDDVLVTPGSTLDFSTLTSGKLVPVD